MACGKCSAVQGGVFGYEDKVEGIGADGVDGFTIVRAISASKGYQSENDREKSEHGSGSLYSSYRYRTR